MESYWFTPRPKEAEHHHPFLVFDSSDRLHLPLTIFGKEAIHRLSPTTVQTYLHALLPFFTWLDSDVWQVRAGVRWDAPPRQVRQAVEDYLMSKLRCKVQLHQQGWRLVSIWKEKVHMRLTIELVPRPCWYSNLRSKMTRATWDHLRTLISTTYNDRCGICHESQHVSGVTLHCHEIWHYDDQNHVQRLAGFIALCEMCHHCKHIGLAGIRASEGTLDFQRVIAHFMQVNQCSYEEYEAHSRAAWDIWHERNRHQWVTDLGSYKIW